MLRGGCDQVRKCIVDDWAQAVVSLHLPSPTHLAETPATRRGRGVDIAGGIFCPHVENVKMLLANRQEPLNGRIRIGNSHGLFHRSLASAPLPLAPPIAGCDMRCSCTQPRTGLRACSPAPRPLRRPGACHRPSQGDSRLAVARALSNLLRKNPSEKIRVVGTGFAFSWSGDRTADRAMIRRHPCDTIV